MRVGDRNEEVVELLLSKGADPLVKGDDGQTPLSLAMDIKREGILKLLRAHIDPNDETRMVGSTAVSSQYSKYASRKQLREEDNLDHAIQDRYIHTSL